MKTNQFPDWIYESLPGFFKELTPEFNGLEKDIILLSCIGALSAVLPKVHFYYRGEKIFTNLYVMLIAPPASGKGKMNLALELVLKIDNFLQNYSKNQRKECLNNKDVPDDECPPVRLKIIPGNITSARIYQLIERESKGVLIFESEIDTLSSLLKQDWGNFSDVLRKAFHHERISISRKTDDETLTIDEPKLSMVLSGTPGQVRPLVEGVENGLFSRFVYYYFESKSEWDYASPTNQSNQLRLKFQKAGECIFDLYEDLLERDPIKVVFSQEHYDLLNALFEEYTTRLSDSSGYFNSVVRRHAIVLKRIASILSIIRNIDSVPYDGVIKCNNVDYKIAHTITEILLHHGLFIHNRLKEKEKAQFNVKQSTLLNALPDNFQRREAIVIAEQLAIPYRTADYWLKSFTEQGALIKIENGRYAKQ